MSREASSNRALEVADWQSWWGDVEFRHEESGETEYHFGWNIHVHYADGAGQRYEALTIGELNRMVEHLGIEIECPPDLLDRVECSCDLCK